MFHVASMIPFAEDDEQQLSRKRHIGNDVTACIFLDRAPDSTFSYCPSTITTHFNHVLSIISPAHGLGGYHVQFVHKDCVGDYSPQIPSEPFFVCPPFLLSSASRIAASYAL